MNGKQLGPYRVLDKLGEGGMGEVYRARDTRLGRDVAIKVLPAHLAADPDARARFEREARAISSLNHPHICALYDVGREMPAGARNPVDFLVMELLEGEPLSDRLARGPLPLPEVFRVGAQIADALDKAHRKGFVHRDLKPANVMLNKAGAKLLDFGLARHVTPGAPGVAPSVTLTREVSGTGTIAGTFHYMAPEQIEGREADARTDIWALGATLFEMTTASRPFGGTNTASLMSAILRDEPPRVRMTQPLTPPALDRLINRCLAKDPDDRWQSAADLKHELLWIAQAGGESPVPTAVAPRPIRAAGLWWAVTAALTATAGLAGWWLAPRQTPPGAPIVRAALALPPGDALPRNDVMDLSQTLALARGGRFVAYSTDDAESRLVLRALDTGESRVLASANTMAELFFSPDGRFLAFVSGSGGSNRPGSPGVGGELRTVSVGGGAPVTVVSGIFTSKGGSWGDDGWIYYSPAPAAGLWRVRQEGGAPERLTTPDRARGEKTHRRPFVLPGSKALLFVVGTGRIASFDDARIEALSLADRARHPLLQGGTAPSYLPSEHLLYSRGDKLLAVRFDPDRLEIRGAPVTVLDGVEHWPASGVSHYAVSSTGSLIYNATRHRTALDAVRVRPPGRGDESGGRAVTHGDLLLPDFTRRDPRGRRP